MGRSPVSVVIQLPNGVNASSRKILSWVLVFMEGGPGGEEVTDLGEAML